MKTLKIFLYIIGTLVILLVITLITEKILERNINYRIKVLKNENGPTRKRIEAIEFIAEKKAYDKIPELMPYIDSEESFLYLGKDPYTMTCAVTLALEKMTNKEYGNTCDSSNSKTVEEIIEIKRKWKNWYEIEYLK